MHERNATVITLIRCVSGTGFHTVFYHLSLSCLPHTYRSCVLCWSEGVKAVHVFGRRQILADGRRRCLGCDSNSRIGHGTD